jgi:catechol 2,3-dioxygenase-like lactoylglutathione lyase family enzyme
MSSTNVSTDSGTHTSADTAVAMRLEVAVLAVADVDRAQEFYQGLGWRVDADVAGANGYRLVQLTPPASNASVIFGHGVTTAEPGAGAPLLMAVDDMEAAREHLLAHGVDVSEAFHDAGGDLGGGFIADPRGRASGPDPEGRSYATYASFSDPDGNQWLLQQVTSRLPGRLWD